MANGLFTDVLKDYYGAEVGGYTTVTTPEINKMTYNVKAAIRKMMVERVGREGITQNGDATPTRFNLSERLSSDVRKTVDMVCKFSKPDKDEMTIYISSSIIAKADQHEDDVWCIYYKPGTNVPWFDYVSKDQWSYISNPLVGDIYAEPDEISPAGSGVVSPLSYCVDVCDMRIKEVDVPRGVSRHSGSRKKKQPANIVSAANMKTILKNQKIKGTRGEEIVLRYEKERLKEAGRPDLASKVVWVASKADGYGYDIVSYEHNAERDVWEEIYIEVKTTSLLSPTTPFYISETEKRISEEKGKRYYIYRVCAITSVAKEALLFRINGPIESNFSLAPSAYIASLK